MKPQPACPECERLSDVADKSNAIGEFLDYFLPNKGIILAKHIKEVRYNEDMEQEEEIEDSEYLFPAYEYQGTNGINKLLAEYFNIDLNKVEQERRALLEWLREAQETKK
jgi:hypothetical protein